MKPALASNCGKYFLPAHCWRVLFGRGWRASTFGEYFSNTFLFLVLKSRIGTCEYFPNTFRILCRTLQAYNDAFPSKKYSQSTRQLRFTTLQQVLAKYAPILMLDRKYLPPSVAFSNLDPRGQPLETFNQHLPSHSNITRQVDKLIDNAYHAYKTIVWTMPGPGPGAQPRSTLAGERSEPLGALGGAGAMGLLEGSILGQHAP